MPTLRQWGLFFYASVAMTIFIMIIIGCIQSVEISNNWNSNRCNPMFMLFSGNVEENFTYCVQNIQTSMMGQALQPITWSMSNLASVSSILSEGLNDTRQMFDNTRNFITNIVSIVFGTLLNLVVEFQKLSLNISDIGAKIIGTMTGLLFILDGTNKTMLSAWNGPPGQLTRKLGSCFEYNQIINNKPINQYKAGDVIGKSIIKNVLIIEQDGTELMYNFNGFIISGSHTVYYNGSMIRIENHPQSIFLRNTREKEKLVCFITNTGTIPVDKFIFGDYLSRA